MAGIRYKEQRLDNLHNAGAAITGRNEAYSARQCEILCTAYFKQKSPYRSSGKSLKEVVQMETELHQLTKVLPQSQGKSSQISSIAESHSLFFDEFGGIHYKDCNRAEYPTGHNMNIILEANGWNENKLSESNVRSLNILFRYIHSKKCEELRKAEEKPMLSISKSNHWKYGQDYSRNEY
jgi:hypothetical protein